MQVEFLISTITDKNGERIDKDALRKLLIIGRKDPINFNGECVGELELIRVEEQKDGFYVTYSDGKIDDMNEFTYDAIGV